MLNMQVIKSSIIALILSFSTYAATAAPCADDDYWTFGKTLDGVTRTCAWIREKPDPRKDNWCSRNAPNSHLFVQEKCPAACGKCNNIPIPGCMNFPPGWHDATGAEYNCDYYKQGDNCAIFGKSFPKDGKTANDVCCECGGGCANFRVSYLDISDKDFELFDRPGPKKFEWFDSRRNFCSYYAEDVSRCARGSMFENFGYVANEACCVCGGGTPEGPVLPTPPPTTPPPAFAAKDEVVSEE